MMMVMNKRSILSLVILSSQVVRSEIIPFELILDASSTEIHFVRGWLDAPAHIDLSNLRFITTSEPDFAHGDDEFGDDEFQLDDDEFTTNAPTPATNNNNNNAGGDTETPAPVDTTSNTPAPVEPADDVSTPSPAPTDDETTPAPDDGNGDGAPADDGNNTTSVPGDDGNTTPAPAPAEDGKTLAPTDDSEGDNGSTPAPSAAGGDRQRQRRNLNLDGEENGGGVTAQRIQQILDIVLFMIPGDCKKNVWGQCDWGTLGLGALDNEVEGGVTYCCSEDAATRSICDASEVGTLIVNHNLFNGDHRKVHVPATEDKEFYMKNAMFDISDTGDYILVLGNCYDDGLEVLTIGSMEWKSVGGYLPGDKFGLMSFYAALTVVYLVLVLWYWCGMRMFQESSIPIQKYILTTMILGLLELTCRALDLGIWNLQGLRSYGIVYSALFLGVLKRGLSRCLGVMVAMGWGVVRESLGTTLIKIVFLGLIYSGLTLSRDILVVVASTTVEKISTSAEEELIDLVLILTPAIIVINLVFYFWIISSLNSTTEYLQNMNQTSKLRRHSRLRCIMMISITIAAAWLMFSIADVFADILGTDQMWMLEGAMHANYLFVLTGVAILWRPNSNAKDYALQIELPALGDEYEDELELSCVVPSAEDMQDGNDPDHPNGLPVDAGVVS